MQTWDMMSWLPTMVTAGAVTGLVNVYVLLNWSADYWMMSLPPEFLVIILAVCKFGTEYLTALLTVKENSAANVDQCVVMYFLCRDDQWPL